MLINPTQQKTLYRYAELSEGAQNRALKDYLTDGDGETSPSDALQIVTIDHAEDWFYDAKGNFIDEIDQPKEEENPFGPVVFSYTRQEAIDDGVLHDEPLDSIATLCGIKWHTAMTQDLLFRASKDPALEKILCTKLILNFKRTLQEKVSKGEASVSFGDRWPVVLEPVSVLPETFNGLTAHVVFSHEPPFGPCWTFMLPHED